jgi:hypothetical protein
MTTSEELISRATQLATTGPDAGSDLARVTLEIADRLRIEVASNLKLELIVHGRVKAVEKCKG